MERIEKLWNKGEPEIFVRALGAAIPRAINLCLQFQNEHHKILDLEVSTNTVKIIGEWLVNGTMYEFYVQHFLN